jgi:hypothetical protein
MLKILRKLFSTNDDKPKTSLLFSNAEEHDILLKDVLDEYVTKFNNRFSVHYTLTRLQDVSIFFSLLTFIENKLERIYQKNRCRNDQTNNATALFQNEDLIMWSCRNDQFSTKLATTTGLHRSYDLFLHIALTKTFIHLHIVLIYSTGMP